MKFFDAGQHAVGFIAIGQIATGFIAVGQVATGVIAIGQLARGGIVVGQGAVGLVAWGMGAIGLFRCAGMVGLGGRAGLGLVLPLVPTLPKHHDDPEVLPFEQIRAGQKGFVKATAVRDGGAFVLELDGQRLPIKIDRELLGPMQPYLASGPVTVFANVKPVGSVLVCTEVKVTPAPAHRKPYFALTAVLGVAAMIGIGIGFWPAAGNDVVEALVASDPAPPKPTPAPAPPPRPSKPKR